MVQPFKQLPNLSISDKAGQFCRGLAFVFSSKSEIFSCFKRDVHADFAHRKWLVEAHGSNYCTQELYDFSAFLNKSNLKYHSCDIKADNENTVSKYLESQY